MKRRTRKSASSHSALRAGDARPATAERGGGGLGSGERETSEPDRLVGTTLAGKYRLEELLGEGAMGRVYRARHVGLDRPVAIKVLHERLSGEERVEKRFHREARAASRLSHPNSVQVLDFGATDEGILFIAMELLDGEDLQVILDHDAPLSPRRIASILGQALHALDEAHHVGIIHRDFKPENIVVSTDRDGHDVVKVCDFGIAKIMDGEGQSITVDGFVCGTPQYMAPEQARGEDIDPRLDLYAAGVVLYQMLAGAPPFTADTALGIITKHLTDEPVAPSVRRPELGIPEALEHIALRAMSKARAERYGSAKEMADALAAAVQSLGPLADTRLGEGGFEERARAVEHAATLEVARSTPPASLAVGARSPRSRAWLGALVVLALLGAIALWLSSRPRPTSLPEDARADRARGVSAERATQAGRRDPASAPEASPAPPEPRVGDEPARLAPSTPATDRAASRDRVSPPRARMSTEPHEAERAAPRPAPATTDRGSSTAAQASSGTPAERAFERGRAAFMAQDVEGAISAFEEAARLSPSDANVQKQLGRAYMRAGQRDRGVAAYRRYLELDPSARDRAVVESIIAEHSR